MTPQTKAWLEITRVSNLPTVLGGVLITIALNEAFQWQFFIPMLMGKWSPLFTMLAAIACFYMAGFILNDVFDRAIDKEERPGRPIPSGRITVRNAVQVAVFMIAGGLLLVAESDQLFEQSSLDRGIPSGLSAAVVLVGLIVLYNRFHLASSWTVFLMAGCRAMVYLTCLMVSIDSIDALSATWDIYLSMAGILYSPFLPFVVGIFLYVAGFSRIARGEVTTGGEGRFCYQCGFQCLPDATRCPECALEFDPERLERSTQPPLKRNLENLCLAATFLPAALLLGLGCWRLALEIYFSRWVTTDEFVAYFIPGLIAVATSLIVTLLLIGWLVVATIRYRSDRTRPTRSILMWIAALPLMDANLSLYMNLPLWTSLACLGLFFITIWGHRRIPGT